MPEKETLKRQDWHIDYRRRLLNPHWSEKEINEVEELASIKGVHPMTVVRTAISQYVEANAPIV